MNPVYVTQACAIASLGPDLEAIFNGLVQNRTGISGIERFDTDGCGCHCAGIIRDLEKGRHPSLAHALASRLIKQLPPMDPDTFLIVSSAKAASDLIPGCNPDAPLPDAVFLSHLTAYIQSALGLSHKGININCACTSSAIAVAKAAALVEKGMAPKVLVCCLDIVSPFVFKGFWSLGAMSESPARPFDKNRSGLTLGEGAAALLLEPGGNENKLTATPLGRIRGWGIANDAVHLTAPAKDGRGLTLAIRKAVKTSGVDIRDIRAVNTHGTGTLHNDAMELVVLNKLFDTGRISANSVKGALGHTLGAAGGLEAALGLKMLEQKTLVGTIGLSEPEKEALPFIRTECVFLEGNFLLTTNSGFGGTNAALILEAIS